LKGIPVDPLLKKLNYRGPEPLYTLNTPAELLSWIARTPEVRALCPAAEIPLQSPLLAFVTTLADIDAVASWCQALMGDPLLWLAYPKQSSRRYRCTFHRDTGWEALGEVGFEAVLQVAINDDWNALRFRRPALHALSQAGKTRTQGHRLPNVESP
jgi:hypothetical protein